MNGTANNTTGGLQKHDLKKNDRGKIVSKKASEAAKRNYARNNALQKWNELVKRVYERSNYKGQKDALARAMKEASHLRKSGKA